MTGITPGRVATEFWRWLWAGIGALALAGVLTLIFWQAGWWFRSQNTSREAHLIRNSYANQQTLREQVTAQIGNVATLTSQIAATHDQNLAAALTAQRAAVAAIVCQDAAEVTGDPLPASQATWVSANCEAGNVSPGSPYYQSGSTP